MATALLKASALVVMPDDGNGDADVDFARLVEVSGAPELTDSYESIERNVVRQAFSTYAPLRGLETTSSSVTIELHGSGIVDQAPESVMFYKSVFGGLTGPTSASETSWEKTDATLTATTTAGVLTGAYTEISEATSPQLYTTVITVGTDETDNFEVGFPVRVHAAGVLKTIGFILEVTSGTELTIITENNAEISIGDTVDCGFLFTLRNLADAEFVQILATPNLNIDYFRGDIVKEAWTGFSGTSFDIDFSTGQVCLPSFSFEGTEVGYDDGSYAASLGTYNVVNTINSVFDSANTSPLVVQLADIFMYKHDLEEDGADGELTDTSPTYFQECISNIQFNITNEVYKKQCIASLGIGEVLRTSRAVTGSLNTFYTGKDFQQAFKNDTNYTLRAIFNYAKSLDTSGNKVFDTAAGNIIAVCCPKLKFSDVSVSEDTGIFKYDSSFSAEPLEGDDEFILAFL